MRIRFCSRLGSFLCAVAVVFWLMAGYWLTAAAAADGMLTLVCKSEGAPLTGMHWNLYRVGEKNANGLVVLEGKFADYPVYLEDYNASAMQDAADTLENYAVLDKIEPLQSGIVSEDGTLAFAGLETGLYLLSGTRLNKGQQIYLPSAMLVEMVPSEEEGQTVGDLTAYAKFEVVERPTESDRVYRVQKVWKYDYNLENLRPVELEVGLYRDGVLFETVILDNSNDWTYSWKSDSTSEWRVKEISVPGDYMVVYRGNETQFVIVNNRWTVESTGLISRPSVTQTTTSATTTSTTASTTSGTVLVTIISTDETTTTTTATQTTTTTTTTGQTTTGSSLPPSTTTTTGGGKLPQTGQLWWPVPVFGAGGLILFAVGWRLNKKK